ncbi:MAG: stage II sporulation protein M [Gammaproteobacteria bacterium]|nr:stage II sporulation protein M [Gammaproteobacteria bacterium]
MTPAALRRWIAQRRPDWARVDRSLAAPMPKQLDLATATACIDDYRRTAHDLAIARRELPGTEVTARLESQLRQLHMRVDDDFEPWRERLSRLYRDEVPAVYFKLRPTLMVMSLIFFGMAIVGWSLVSHFPELAALFASEQLIDGVQRGQLWTDGILNVTPSSVMSFGIIANNVTVALSAFVLGTLYGIGTLYILVLNGAMIGGVLAFTHQHGLGLRLFRFMLAHGVVELSVILIAAAAGVSLGAALARPGLRTRAEALREAVADAACLLAVVVPFLGLAGLIEGFISPVDQYGFLIRLLVGLASGALLWGVLTGRVWRRPSV